MTVEGQTTMRDPAMRRDQREISIPSDARPSARRRTVSGQTRRGAWAGRFGMVLAAAGLCKRHPGEVLGVLLAVGAAGAVSLNALGSQTGRHPAPILANLNTRPAAAPPSKKPVADRAGERPVVEAKPAVEARSDAPRPPARDGIADLLKASEPARPGDTTASVTPKAEDSVIKAQRALVKLGYGPLETDGVLGAGTRAAISRFEKDRKLPVKGEPAGRTLRELAARAGLPPG